MSSQVVAKGAVDAAPFVRLELIAAALRTEVLPAEWWGGADGRGPSRVLRTEFLAGPLPPPRPPRRFMGPGERRARRLHLVLGGSVRRRCRDARIAGAEQSFARFAERSRESQLVLYPLLSAECWRRIVIRSCDACTLNAPSPQLSNWHSTDKPLSAANRANNSFVIGARQPRR